MIDVIVNPIAGDRSGKKIVAKMKVVSNQFEKRGCEYTLHRIDKSQRTRDYIANLIKNGATTIVAMGGDGTLHQVVNGITDFDKISLGLIPCGTGNDFAKNLGIPTDLEKAVDLIVDGIAKPTDYFQLPTVRGINVIGTGIDVDVLKRYTNLKKKSKFGYTWCLIKTLFKFKSTPLTAEFNGKTKRFNCIMAGVCNGSYIGGGLQVSPNACAYDNKLEFLCVDNIKKIKLPNAFLQLKKGKVLQIKTAFTESVTKIKIVGDNNLTLQIDGEIYENIPFEVEIVSDKLKMFRP